MIKPVWGIEIMIISKWRGHEIRYIEDFWIYSDNNIPVMFNPERVCGVCNADNREDDCDPCLGKLPGVSNACCGHGAREDSYIQFENGFIIRGFILNAASEQNVREGMIKAHMAGQADAGVDPSYSNAISYLMEKKDG